MAKGGKRPGAGRKPGIPNKATAEIRTLAQQYAPDAIEELARLAKEAKSEAAQVAAIKEMLDRAYGKARQSMELSADSETMGPAMTAAAEAVGAKLSQLIERGEERLLAESLQTTTSKRVSD